MYYGRGRRGLVEQSERKKRQLRLVFIKYGKHRRKRNVDI